MYRRHLSRISLPALSRVEELEPRIVLHAGLTSPLALAAGVAWVHTASQNSVSVDWSEGNGGWCHHRRHPHTWNQSTVAAFQQGDNNGTRVTPAHGGAVELGPVVTDQFDGTALSSAWISTSWDSIGGGPSQVTVGGGVVTVAGMEIRSAQTFAAAPVVGRLNFGAATYEHFGMATDVNMVAGNSWAMFTTLGTTDTLYATVNIAGVFTSVSIGALPTGFHIYRVQPTASGFGFYVDDTLKATLAGTMSSGTNLHVVLSTMHGAPAQGLTADWVHVDALAMTGTYTSSVFDAGRLAHWRKADWIACLPAGTTMVVQTRSGADATPDSSWSAWTNVIDGQDVTSPDARYLQYQVIFTTTDPTVTPALYHITFHWRPAHHPTANVGDQTGP